MLKTLYDRCGTQFTGSSDVTVNIEPPQKSAMRQKNNKFHTSLRPTDGGKLPWSE